MPRQLFGFIWRASGIHQVWLTLLCVVLFVFGVTSLEIQRRFVNDAFRGGIFRPIVLLVLAYLAIVVTEGLLKLGLNIYRNWIGEGAVRWLRFAVFAAADPGSAPNYSETAEGIQLSIVLDKADPIGGFVGECISEPVLQAGVLVSVTGYLLYL